MEYHSKNWVRSNLIRRDNPLIKRFITIYLKSVDVGLWFHLEFKSSKILWYSYFWYLYYKIPMRMRNSYLGLSMKGMYWLYDTPWVSWCYSKCLDFLVTPRVNYMPLWNLLFYASPMSELFVGQRSWHFYPYFMRESILVRDTLWS